VKQYVQGGKQYDIWNMKKKCIICKLREWNKLKNWIWLSMFLWITSLVYIVKQLCRWFCICRFHIMELSERK